MFWSLPTSVMQTRRRKQEEDPSHLRWDMVFVGKRLAESCVVFLNFIVAVGVFMTVNLNLSLVWHLDETRRVSD